jgi:tetratricopeptide (TPR) repeat protein
MGVRAVVAAGWAVRDGAALNFSSKFYARMLDGETFGSALKEARADTYQRFDGCNTWGAYQAYGDPDYRLDPSASRTGSSLASHVDVAEFVEAIKEIQRSVKRATWASDGGQKTRSVARERLDTLVKACPPAWLAQTSVLMEVGYAYGDLGNFDGANRYLLAALESDESESATTLRSVEQLANFEVRLARDVGKSAKDPAAKARSRAELDKAIRRIEKLLEVSETGERLSLLGSAYKRKAEMEEARDQAEELVRLAADQYKKAYLRYLERKRFDPYPVLNWLGAELVLRNPVTDIETLLQRCEAAASERFQVNQTFFEAVNGPDAALLRVLASGALGKADKEAEREIDRLVHTYLEVIRRTQSSGREIDSTISQMELTENLIKKLRPENAETRSTVAALARIRTAIAGTRPASAGKADTVGPQVGGPVDRGNAPSTAAPGPSGKRNQRRARKTAGTKKPESKGRKP